MAPITRRAFLGAGGALVVGLALDGRTPRRAAARSRPLRRRPRGRPTATSARPRPTRWTPFAIHADNTITVSRAR